MVIERKTNLRRYHLDTGDIVIVCRTPDGRVVSITPAYPPNINFRIHPMVAAHSLVMTRRRERAA